MVRRWDQWRNPWDREYAKRGRLWRGQASAEPLLGLAPPPADVLEVGCGDGKLLSSLARAGYRVVGLDFSRRALGLIAPQPNLARLHADARHLPIRDAAFQVVAARYVLGALLERHRQDAASEIARVVAPGGVVWVEEFTTEDFRSDKGTQVEPGTVERNEGITTHYFEEDELDASVPGLELVEAKTVKGRLRVAGATYPRVFRRAFFRRPA